MTLAVGSRTAIALPGVLAGGAVAVQVAYPLVAGSTRDRLTVLIVLLYAATSIAHAALTRGARVVFVLVGSTVVFGFAVEVAGVHSGVPFGRYAYGAALGPTLFGVPIVIAFAWMMLGWPAALVAQRLATSLLVRVVVGAWALAAWDLFLDPQMVAAGYWRWRDPSRHLPGIPDVPIADFVGWFAVAALISLALQRALDSTSRPAPADDRVPLGLYLWTWASSTVALAAFFDLPVAAVWGALAMGMVALPLLRSFRA
jgi:uncharacterized membrane protein